MINENENKAENEKQITWIRALDMEINVLNIKWVSA